jgi:hypothetical protein
LLPANGTFGPDATVPGRVLLELLAQGWTPARFAATSVVALRGLFAVRGCRLTRPLATRLIGRAQAALPAHPAVTAGKAATLAALLGTIDTLDREIACLEAAMAPLLARTQGAKLTQLRGVGVVAASGFVAFVGSTDRWAEWSKVWRAAGLDPARSQSGPTDARLGISREGSAWGRRAILDLAAAVCQQPGPWRDRLRTRTTQQHNPPRSLSRPPPTPSVAPCLHSWPRAPTLILASKPTAQRGRQVVKQPEPEDTGGLRGADQTPFSGDEARPRA